MRALRDVAEPVADLLGPMPYRRSRRCSTRSGRRAPRLLQGDEPRPPRRRADRRGCASSTSQAPGPQCEIHVHQMGGAVARVGEGDTAFAERSMPFVLNAVTGWHDPARGRCAHRVGAGGDRGRRRTPRPAARTSTSSATPARPVVVRRGDLRAARRAEGRVRPDERVPAEPEHRALGSSPSEAGGAPHAPRIKKKKTKAGVRAPGGPRPPGSGSTDTAFGRRG